MCSNHAGCTRRNFEPSLLREGFKFLLDFLAVSRIMFGHPGISQMLASRKRAGVRYHVGCTIFALTLVLFYNLVMKNAIILHGKPTRDRYENSNEPKPHEANWLPWLKAQLEAQKINVSIPALPLPYFPVYEDWKNVFEREEVTGHTKLIGHSAGAEFILRWLSEKKRSCC